MSEPNRNRDPLATMKVVGAVLTTLLVLMLVDFFTDVGSGHHGAHDTFEETVAYLIAPDVMETQTEGDDGPMLTLTDWLAQADFDRGAKVIKKCVSCHAVSKGAAHKIGPTLWDVVGAAVGVHGDYAYSKAALSFAEEGKRWDAEALDGFLQSPRQYMSGTKMSFVGLRDPQQRADVILWLAQQSDTPKTVP